MRDDWFSWAGRVKAVMTGRRDGAGAASGAVRATAPAVDAAISGIFSDAQPQVR